MRLKIVPAVGVICVVGTFGALAMLSKHQKDTKAEEARQSVCAEFRLEYEKMASGWQRYNFDRETIEGMVARCNQDDAKIRESNKSNTHSGQRVKECWQWRTQLENWKEGRLYLGTPAELRAKSVACDLEGVPHPDIPPADRK